MRLLNWFSDDSRRRPRGRERAQNPQPEGDFRGRYGFGRRAHRPDPDATYAFEPDANRRPRRPEIS
jgi:hypothetical protein